MRVAILTLVAAAYTGLATACSQQPVGSVPSGNPITAPVLQVVEAGKPFAITWTVRGPEIILPVSCDHTDANRSPPPRGPCPSCSSAAPRKT